MVQIEMCPKCKIRLIYHKDTDTHILFKCPTCDYIAPPTTVHPDLPEKYTQLKGELKNMRQYHWAELNTIRCALLNQTEDLKVLTEDVRLKEVELKKALK